MSRIDDDAALAAEIATTAGKLLLALRDSALFEGKAAGKAGDFTANAFILSALAAQRPDDAILSEEEKNDTARCARSRVWVVDPLDGTREFVKRNGEFSVNLALIERGEPVFGLVLAPVGGALWHGARGGHAYRRDGDAERRVRVQAPPAQPMRVAASRSHHSQRSDDFLARAHREAPGGIAMVSLGSSLKFCRIAEGSLDLYPRFGPTSEWDTAAGQCVLEAAGGALLDPRGRPFRYNQREHLLNGDFIALGDASLPWRTWRDG